MKKTKGFEKNIEIYIKNQESLALTYFDQAVYDELKDNLITYESNFDESGENKTSDAMLRKINVRVTIEEDCNDLQIALKVYRKLNGLIEALECKVVIDDDVFVDGII